MRRDLGDRHLCRRLSGRTVARPRAVAELPSHATLLRHHHFFEVLPHPSAADSAMRLNCRLFVLQSQQEYKIARCDNQATAEILNSTAAAASLGVLELPH